MTATKLVPLKSRDEAAELMKQRAHWTALLGVTVAERDRAVLQVQQKHQPAINQLSAEISIADERLIIWAQEDRAQFGDKREIEFSAGCIRARMVPRSLVLRSGWDWKKVENKLLSFPVTSQWREYLNFDPSINKRRLLDDTKPGGKLPESKLPEIGLRVVQEEKFTIECKPEDAVPDPMP